MAGSSGGGQRGGGPRPPSDPTIDLEDLELELESADLLQLVKPPSPPPVPIERPSGSPPPPPAEPRPSWPVPRPSQPPPPPREPTGPRTLGGETTSQPPPPPLKEPTPARTGSSQTPSQPPPVEVITATTKNDGRQQTVPGVAAPAPKPRRSSRAPDAPGRQSRATETTQDDAATVRQRPEVPPAERPLLPAAESLIQSLEAEAKATVDDGGRLAALLYEIGRLEEERRGEPRGARARYRAALEADADHLPSIRALRRLEDAAGNTPEAIRLLEHELRLTADDRQRAEVSAQLGRLLEARSQPDRAVAAYRRALELNGACLDAIEALIALYQAEKQWVPLSEILLRAAGNTTDPRRKAILTARAASVREAFLDQEAAAEALYATALGHAPDLGHVAADLARLYRLRGRWAELAQLERAEAERAETTSAKALHLYRAGRLYADRAGDPAAAEACFVAASELSPRDEVARSAMADVQRRKGDFETLEKTLVDGLDGLRERDRAVAARFEVARLRADRLGKVPEAVEALKEALELDPRHLASLHALSDLLSELGRYDELVEVTAAEVDRLVDERARADAYHELGQLVERRLDDPDRAALFYRASLDLEPHHAAAFESLERLYARQEAWAELTDVLETASAATPDRRRAAARLSRAVALAEHRLGDLDRAVALARKLLDLRPNDLEAIARLGRLLEATGALEERVKLLWREVELAEHEPERVDLLMRIAALLEVRLDAPDKARGVLRKVIEMHPSHGAALRAMGRIDRRAGRYEDLLATLRHELEAGPSQEESTLLHYRVGRLLEEKLGRTDEAMDAYRASLAEDPAFAPASDALERLLRTLGLWSDLAGLLEVTAASSSEGAERRAAAWFKVGELREERLGDDEGAAEAYREALKLQSEHEPSRVGMLRILEGKGRWSEVAQGLEAEATHRSGQRRVDTLLRLATLRATRLGDRAGAIAALTDAEAEAPRNLAVQEGLVRLSREAKDWERLGRAFGRYVAALGSPRDSAAALKRAAIDARAHPAVGDPVALYRNILEIEPDETSAIDALEECILPAAEKELLLEVTSRRLLVEPSEALRLPLLLRQGELRAGMGDVEGAIASFEGALALAPGSVTALRALSTLKAAAGDQEAVAALREREAEVSKVPEAATRALIEAGELRLGHLGQEDEALRCFRRVLEIAPGHGPAYHRLTGILERGERWTELAEAMGTRLASVTDETEEVGLRLRLALIQRDKLDQAEDAVATLKGLLAIEKDNRKALETLGDLYSRLTRWRESAEAYAKAIGVAEAKGEPKAAHRTRLSLAETQLRRLGEFDAAARTLEEALARSPGDLAALRLRVDVQKRRGDVKAAASALTDLAEALPRGERAPVLMELAELLANEAEDPAGAAAALQRAAADSPGDREPLRRLEEHFGRLGDWEGLARALAWAVDHAGGDAVTTALLRVELAKTLIEKQGRVAAGVEHLEAVLEAQPSNAAARFALARRHRLPPGRPDLAETEYRRILQDDPWNMDALREVFALLTTGKDPSRAQPVAMLLAYLGDREAGAAATAKTPARRALGSDGYDQWIADPAEPPVFAGLLRAVQCALERVYPLDLERHGASREDRAGTGDVLHAAVAQVAARLGLPTGETFISHRSRTACAVEPGEPPRVVVGVSLTSYPAGLRRFELGRALGPLVSGSLLFSKVPRRELPALLSAIVGSVVRGYNKMGDPDEVTELTKLVSRALPRKTKKLIEEAARRAAVSGLPDLDAWIRAADRSADRCGLLACADIGSALDAVRAREEGRGPARHESMEDRRASLRGYRPAVELAVYWLSPRCEAALAELGTP